MGERIFSSDPSALRTFFGPLSGGEHMNRGGTQMPTIFNVSSRFDTSRAQSSLLKGEEISLRYFHTALWVMIGIGALWGVILLWQLKIAGEFTSLNLFEVNAHGQGQVYGWLGLVFMGACYRNLAFASRISFPFAPLCLVISGIFLNMGGLYFFQSPWLTFLGGLCLVAAAFAFSIQIYPFVAQAERGAPPFLRMGLAFLLFSVFYSLWHHQKISILGVETEILRQVANFQAPLRDLQIHGMALFLVAGLFAGFKSWKGWLFLTAGVIGEAALFIIFRTTEQTLFASLLLLPWLFLLLGTVSIRLPFKVPNGWLILSLIMLLLLPLYSYFSHLRFSHAYYGAIRHAVTVGCFSQIALLIMPIQNGRRAFFFLPIALLNLGCMARVVLQILTDFHPIGYALIPFSGMIELAAVMISLFYLTATQRKPIKSL